MSSTSNMRCASSESGTSDACSTSVANSATSSASGASSTSSANTVNSVNSTSSISCANNMSEPLRVLQVVTTMNRGGLETMIMNHYRHIDRSKVQFDFLTHREEPGAYEEEIKQLGGRIYRVKRANSLDPGYRRQLNQFFAEHPYKVVHSHIDCMSGSVLAAAKKAGAVMRVAHSHNSRQDRDIKYPIKLLCKKDIKNQATHLLACGKEAGKWMFGTDNFKVFPNAIEVEAYEFNEGVRAKIRYELSIPQDAFVVGHVGRFSEVKNHKFLVEIFNEYLKLSNNTYLVCAGDGATLPNVQVQVAQLGLNDKVKLLGLRSDINEVMQAMDAFVMPSVYEGLPLVLVEAQASGLPCYISDTIPADCDLIPADITRLSLADSPATWASKILESSAQPKDRTRGVAQVTKAGFNAKESAKQLMTFYQQGLN